MTRPFVSIHNTKTDEVITREMNDTEFSEYEAGQAAAALQATALAQADTARTAAVAKLAKLGLTVDDLQALGLGGN